MDSLAHSRKDTVDAKSLNSEVNVHSVSLFVISFAFLVAMVCGGHACMHAWCRVTQLNEWLSYAVEGVSTRTQARGMFD